eukprot:1160610-Pelagomonas_calceolata.AAC.13
MLLLKTPRSCLTLLSLTRPLRYLSTAPADNGAPWRTMSLELELRDPCSSAMARNSAVCRERCGKKGGRANELESWDPCGPAMPRFSAVCRERCGKKGGKPRGEMRWNIRSCAALQCNG